MSSYLAAASNTILWDDYESRRLRNKVWLPVRHFPGRPTSDLGRVTTLSRSDSLWYHATFYTMATGRCSLGGNTIWTWVQLLTNKMYGRSILHVHMTWCTATRQLCLHNCQINICLHPRAPMYNASSVACEDKVCGHVFACNYVRVFCHLLRYSAVLSVCEPKALYPRRWQHSPLPLWEPLILHMCARICMNIWAVLYSGG
jgi:hypothetical protein